MMIQSIEIFPLEVLEPFQSVELLMLASIEAAKR